LRTAIPMKAAVEAQASAATRQPVAYVGQSASRYVIDLA
jgi:hypothetical protein